MSNIVLEAKPIGDIKGTFIVPEYQRGYRWTESQVKTLLNDLWENCSQEINKEYCLQPVVVRNCGDMKYELIDGQQRFTTTLIILTYIQQRFPTLVQINYSLEYETRKSTAQFLANINENTAQDNIDFLHIYNAYKCIELWLNEKFVDDITKQSIALLDLLKYLISKVKVIWYEVGDNEDSIELFTRLNIGRIQLTNAELIKALLLKDYNDDNIDKDKIERSIQWDGIEKELRSHNDELWYFLTTKNASSYSTRIEFLFDMMACKASNERDIYYTFFWFEQEIKTRGVDVIWKEIQNNFLQIKEWYTDNELYHKIGYLISSGSKTMMDMFNLAKGKLKSQFRNDLDDLIAESINFKLDEAETYRDLNYKDNEKDISKLLLLFNIESIIKKGVYQRFPFSKYNTAEWSLEHIHAQNSQALTKKETQLEWISMHLDSVRAVSHNGKYDALISKMEEIKLDGRHTFEEIYRDVCNALSEDGDVDYLHTISNMALLERKNNAALNNSTFDVKRNQIVKLDQAGAFIPYCTKMVFLKYYTPSDKNQIHFWGQSDRTAYIDAMAEVLKPYMDKIKKTF